MTKAKQFHITIIPGVNDLATLRADLAELEQVAKEGFDLSVEIAETKEAIALTEAQLASVPASKPIEKIKQGKYVKRKSPAKRDPYDLVSTTLLDAMLAEVRKQAVRTIKANPDAPSLHRSIEQIEAQYQGAMSDDDEPALYQLSIQRAALELALNALHGIPK